MFRKIINRVIKNKNVTGMSKCLCFSLSSNDYFIWGKMETEMFGHKNYITSKLKYKVTKDFLQETKKQRHGVDGNEISSAGNCPYSVSWKKLASHLYIWFSHRQELKCRSRNSFRIVQLLLDVWTTCPCNMMITQYFKMLGTTHTVSHPTRLKSSRVTSSLNNFVKKIISIKISK